MRLVQATTAGQIDLARQLFREYADWLQVDLCFQSFDKELAELPGAYAPPSGCLLLAYHDDELAGCIALRKIGEGVCEMKRVFVREKFRGKGLVRSLLGAVISSVKTIGYAGYGLDTLPAHMNSSEDRY